MDRPVTALDAIATPIAVAAHRVRAAAAAPAGVRDERPADPRDRALPADRVTVTSEARRAARSAGARDALDAADRRLVLELSARDAEVRAHEAAHQAAGGALAGAASFTFQQGPDGKQYAVGGEVPISMRPGRTDDETIANAQQVRRAALAPAEPSPQDLAVAAQATAIEQAARARKAQAAARAYAAAGPATDGSVPGGPEARHAAARDALSPAGR